jgi:hypothetical protein
MVINHNQREPGQSRGKTAPEADDHPEAEDAKTEADEHDFGVLKTDRAEGEQVGSPAIPNEKTQTDPKERRRACRSFV